MRTIFDVPENVIIDSGTGLPLNIPLGRVTPPGWQQTNSDEYQRIIELRKQRGIEIEDDELVTIAPEDFRDGFDGKKKPKPAAPVRRRRRN